ncbi:MAG: phosphotransferase [Lachnospiraceae bacterium]|nr:phosphotransferase [Lachnospiraceae bacterium]
MNDRAVSLFEKYDFIIEKTRKGRGAIIAETDKGTVALMEYNGPQDHLQLEEMVLLKVAERYDGPLDLIVRTAEEELFCSDYEGKKYIVKKYVEGRECDVSSREECRAASRALAELHLAMRNINLPDRPDDFYKPDDLQEDFGRRTAEIVRTRNYIRKSPRKEEFELAFLASYDRYLEQAAVACSFLDESCLVKLRDMQVKEKMLVHGDCTQHNTLLTGKKVAFINFEKMGAHLQLKDVYLFMRKILEKNNWSYVMAEEMLKGYEEVIPLEREEKSYLYARFLYPEKFWKIANGYLNRRKSVPARRQQEKLASFEEKEEKRQLFLNKWLETCR